MTSDRREAALPASLALLVLEDVRHALQCVEFTVEQQKIFNQELCKILHNTLLTLAGELLE